MMTVAERTRMVFTRSGIPDRVPVHCWIGLPLWKRLIPEGMTILEWFKQRLDEPIGLVVEPQEQLGLDPMITTYSQHVGEGEVWPRMLFSYPPEALENWQEDIIEVERDARGRTLRHVIRTPAGEGSYAYRIESYSPWPIEYLLKEHKDIKLIQYRPDPMMMDVSKLKRMVEIVGERAWFLHHPPGPWDEAVELRGLENLMMDIFDEPDWVHQLMRLLTDRIKRHLQKLAETGIHSISLNETWVGVGLSPSVYEEFVLPYDTECVQAAQEAGLLVSYHNCGRGMAILEQMVSTGADALETLTSSVTSGDFDDLAEVKRRVGDKITLFGGFNHLVLNSDDQEDVKGEVRRCLCACMEGGGYILRSFGQIMHAKPDNIRLMCETAKELGSYV